MEIRVHPRIDEVPAAAWDALAGDDDPFVEHAFLAALEESGSVGEDTAWAPLHLTAWEGGALVGALPLYAKGDSWGEFIFDFSWARAASQLRVPYYPKLTSMVPFTPATGRRLLVPEGPSRASIVAALVAGARALAVELGASGLHLLFTTEEETQLLASTSGLWPRLSSQLHWTNEGWRDFDDYLEAFRAPSRKQVRRERRDALAGGLEVRVVEGPLLGDAEWAALDTFYRMNCARHGSEPYLTPRFFERVRATHAHRLVAVLAYRAGTPVAGSINFEKGAHLYGRYWGATEAAEFLHFEVCYYRLIERAIARGVRRFEAGAQGAHKLKRGLLPAATHSAHVVFDPRLGRAIEASLPREAEAVRGEMAALSASTPFKRGDG